MNSGSWYARWSTDLDDQEIIAYIALDRLSSIGGAFESSDGSNQIHRDFYIHQGTAILARWCRQHCQEPGRPVNHSGRTGWAFRHSHDALLFKLTWG
jgi:hypothetical protein